jgi:hypothetical protein
MYLRAERCKYPQLRRFTMHSTSGISQPHKTGASNQIS